MLTLNTLFLRPMLTAGLALTLICSPGSFFLRAAHAQGAGSAPPGPVPSPFVAVSPSAIRSILLFPIAPLDTAPATTSISGRLDEALRLRLDAVGAYKVTRFTRFLSSVQRALDDKDLTNEDIAPPFDPAKGERVASVVATDAFIVGNIDVYNSDAQTGKTTLTVSVDLRLTATGNVVRGLSFTGVAAPVSKSDDPDRVTQAAVNNVAGQIAAAINAGVVRHRPKKK